VDNFANALAAIKMMKSDGVVNDDAIGGAIALTFWSEPTPTFHLDVFVSFQSNGILTSLDPIYRWARAKGYEEKAEHIMMAGLPVQVIPAYNLAAEAVEKAVELDYDGEAVRVIRPEYLIAMSLQGSARTQKRLIRIALLLETVDLDHNLLDDVLRRYHLTLPR
jgi:hypothetical protein